MRAPRPSGLIAAATHPFSQRARSVVSSGVMSSEHTRITRIGAQRRRYVDNASTMIIAEEDLAPVPSPVFHQLFCAQYAAIRDACSSFDQPGVALIAVDRIKRTLAAATCLAAKTDRANAAIIGRHGMTDLYLETDPGVSLRHLAVVLCPLAGDEVRFHLMDLRTPLAFDDERGRRMEALVAEGPMFVRCGRYALFLLLTGDPTAWPDEAEDGWACIPERVYFEEQNARPERWRQRAQRHRRAAQPERASRSTIVQTMRGPSRLRASLLEEGERPAGTLCVATADTSQALSVGRRALREGILLGRYDRCDGDGPAVFTDPKISRVHLLVVAVQDRVYAVDTASTNGIKRRAGREQRVIALDRGAEVVLGDDLGTVTWQGGGISPP